jgi:hypothetical protein
MSYQRIFSNVFFGLVFCVTGLCSFVASPASADASCDHAIVLDLDSTLRLSSLPRGEDAYLRVEIPGPGFLSLDASASGLSKAEPVLVPVGVTCDGVASGRPVVLERTLGSVLVGGESSGGYVFRLTSSDPSEPFSTVKVRSAYLPFGEDEDEIENEPDPFVGGKLPSSFGEDDDEIEEDADPFASGGKLPSSFGEDDDEIEEDADPFTSGKLPSGFGEDDDEIEEDADPFVGGGAGKATVLCGTGETDDHGDTFACASILVPGRQVTGEIGNGWGDDADVFRFVVPGSPGVDLWRAELITTGATAGAGVLFDHRGSRLAQGDAGADGGFRLVEVLSPGVYYLRVEGGFRAEGPYGLGLEVSEP